MIDLQMSWEGEFSSEQRAADLIDEELTRSLGEYAQLVGDTAVTLIKAVTRVDTGALRDSTHHLITQTGPHAIIDIFQDALSQPDQSGNWGGRPYVRWVLLGRGEVRPVFKQALWWPGLDHPIAWAKAWPGDNYIERVQPELESALDMLVDEYGGFFLAQLTE